MQIKTPSQSEQTFSARGRKYHGPEDGRSRPAKSLLKKAANAVLGLAYKVDIQGAEHLPAEGRHVYAPNHPGYFDPLVLSRVTGDTDLRFMAAIENFANPLTARVNEWAGAFPVDRKEPHPQTMKHAEDLIKEGANLGIFPEGRGPETVGVLGAIKPGAALFAVKGEADSIVPMAFHYREGEPTSSDSKKKSLLKSALAAGGAAIAGALGGAVGLAAAAIGVGAAAGSALGARVVRQFVENPNPRTPFPKLIGGALGGLAGGAVGVAGLLALAGSAPLAVAAGSVGLAAGVGTYLWDQWSQGRDVVQVSVAPALEVGEYSQGKGQREAVADLTEALHRSIGGELEKLSEIPYDHDAPKIR